MQLPVGVGVGDGVGLGVGVGVAVGMGVGVAVGFGVGLDVGVAVGVGCGVGDGVGVGIAPLIGVRGSATAVALIGTLPCGAFGIAPIYRPVLVLWIDQPDPLGLTAHASVPCPC
jgi:hypothetical protein